MGCWLISWYWLFFVVFSQIDAEDDMTIRRNALNRVSQVSSTLANIHLQPRSWNFCPSNKSFWRSTASTVVGRLFIEMGTHEIPAYVPITSLVSTDYLTPTLSTHGFTMLQYDSLLKSLVKKTRDLLDILLEQGEDPFLFHVRDNRFGGQQREDVLEVCSEHSFGGFAKPVDPNNTTAAVNNMRAALLLVAERVEMLVTPVYTNYRAELLQIGGEPDRYETLEKIETSPLHLQCEEVFASHTACESVEAHIDTDNSGPLDTVVVWLPLNLVQSNPLALQGQDKWWGTQGLDIGEAVAYLAPGPNLASPLHGSAILPTDLRDDLKEWQTDHRVARERRRLLFVLRVKGKE